MAGQRRPLLRTHFQLRPLARKRYDETELLLLTGYADLKKCLGSQNRMVAQVSGCLHDLYLAWDKPAEAPRYQSDAVIQTTPTL